MDCIVHGVTKSWTQLNNFHFHFTFPLRIFSYWPLGLSHLPPLCKVEGCRYFSSLPQKQGLGK